MKMNRQTKQKRREASVKWWQRILMHSFPPSVTFSLIATQKWTAAIVKTSQNNNTARFSAPVLLSDMKDETWLTAVWSLWLVWQRILTAKKTHAPDCMPPLMGKQFSVEFCGKAVHFLFSRRVVNSTFFGGPSVSLLKGFVMPFLQSGYASDWCVRLRELLGFCGNNNWGAR